MERFVFMSIIISSLLSSFSSCGSPKAWKQVSTLAGTWQVENKSTFETWSLEDNQKLIGKSYKKIKGEHQVLETLSIQRNGKTIVYQATVPHQNEGRTIPFTLNPAVKDKLSFENLQHDFPKKIQYSKVNATRWRVDVVGEGGKGFSLILTIADNL